MQKILQFVYEEYDSRDELIKSDLELVNKAQDSLSLASAQFSNFHVGAACRLSNGEIYSSSNKENTSIITCAEQNLLLHLHSLYKEFKIETLAITFKNMNPGTNSDLPATPCGKCRQLLFEAEENSGGNIRVIMTGQSGKVYVVNSVSSMLPLAYGAHMIV